MECESPIDDGGVIYFFLWFSEMEISFLSLDEPLSNVIAHAVGERGRPEKGERDNPRAWNSRHTARYHRSRSSTQICTLKKKKKREIPACLTTFPLTYNILPPPAYKWRRLFGYTRLDMRRGIQTRTPPSNSLKTARSKCKWAHYVDWAFVERVFVRNANWEQSEEVGVVVISTPIYRGGGGGFTGYLFPRASEFP